jgi:hypothetical protein
MRIDLEVGKQPQFFQGRGFEQLRIVNDDNSGFAEVVVILLNGILQGGHELPFKEAGVETQLRGDAIPHTAQADGGIIDVNPVVLGFLQGFGKGADGGGFTGTDFAGDECYAAAREQGLQPRKQDLELRRQKQRFGGDLLGKRRLQKTEVGGKVTAFIVLGIHDIIS